MRVHESRRKQYVEVVATHRVDGSVRPQSILLTNGPVYNIEQVKGVKLTNFYTSHEIAKEYTVIIHNRQTRLYEDDGRWFVLMKN